MKIIISHDVDHLYPSDHYIKDLVFSKLWIRSSLELLKGRISFRSWYYRLVSIFDKRLNRIPEIIEFDKKHSIPSVFFFGMDNFQGMSYTKSNAISWIKYVLDKGFDAGVHGIEYQDIKKMRKEFNDFKAISNLSSFGIRMHYVRYNETTFRNLAELNYIFDTTEFDKKGIELKPPYKIGGMWEFPLYIMDSYVMKDNLAVAKELTVNAVNEAKEKGLGYFTILFHDYLYNEKTYPHHKAYYEWFIDFCSEQKLEFVSYRTAIKELERNL